MKEEKTNPKQKKPATNSEKGCPLCKVSEDTLERLKEAGKEKKTEQKSTQNNEKVKK